MSADLTDLIARVEAGEGADRGLDAEIAALLRVGTEHEWAYNFPSWEGRSDGRVYLEAGGPSFQAAACTTSLDAVMALVPDGWGWATGSTTYGGYAHLVELDGQGLLQSCAKTPVRALLAAILRAKEAGQ